MNTGFIARNARIGLTVPIDLIGHTARMFTMLPGIRTIGRIMRPTIGLLVPSRVAMQPDIPAILWAAIRRRATTEAMRLPGITQPAITAPGATQRNIPGAITRRTIVPGITRDIRGIVALPPTIARIGRDTRPTSIPAGIIGAIRPGITARTRSAAPGAAPGDHENPNISRK